MRRFIHSTTFSTPLSRPSTTAEKKNKRETSGGGGGGGDKPEVCSISPSLPYERGREITRPFVLSYRARDAATRRRDTTRHIHERHDTRLATEFDIVAAEGVSRKRRALPPPALLRRHMEPRLG